MGLAMADTRCTSNDAKASPKWMGNLVVFCSFVALALGPGLLNAYGVYEEEYDRLFDRKDEAHEWSRALGSPVIFIGVIQIFLANGMGFIGGYFAQRFGPGPAVFTGGLLMAAGLFSASYSHRIWQLCLSQGLLFGLGVCLTWIPAASSPSSWFKKNRGLATGITHMGLGIGGLVFSPLTRFLLEKTGTAGSLRWLALIALVGVSIVSMGIHTKKADRPISDIVVSSARWSKCLEEQQEQAPAHENGYDSETMSYEEYRRASAIARAQGGAQTALLLAASEEGRAGPASAPGEQGVYRNSHGGSGGEGGAATTSAAADVEMHDRLGAPRHVHFAVDTARRAALERLESRQCVGELRQPASEKQRRQRTQARRRGKAPPDAAPEAGPRSVVRSWRFWLLSLGVGAGQAGWYSVLLFIPAIGVSAGLDVHNAAIVLGSVNGASAVGQFVAGYAADLVGPVNALLAFTATATVANTILFVPRLTLRLLLAYACLCGASIGAADPLTVMAGVTQFGRARAATTTGLIYGSVGVLVAVAAPAARMLQHQASARLPFTHVYILVISLFAASTLLLAALRLRISRRLFVRA
ncbi:hypothetical protein H4R21_000257 [Coemansia helicoidea]|uniref:Uncharacterized protein n=1 Tax=Coemansia helicoidea TaxID=1286919 RepID=A0ACC1LH70_9FUNG|nr:hypothetical protein H4R21_000257 [Coemansia helicoidea]